MFAFGKLQTGRVIIAKAQLQILMGFLIGTVCRKLYHDMYRSSVHQFRIKHTPVYQLSACLSRSDGIYLPIALQSLYRFGVWHVQLYIY